ncbi:hypothetical protein FHG87_005840 [Trinorchestia longiramus]|nr:hypothetical protein FHG87_005840 [Trinorchestia longiramus]
MCLVAASSCLRQYLVQEKARLRYRYARWQDARVRQRWLRRQRKYRQDMGEGADFTSRSICKPIDSPTASQVSAKSDSGTKVSSSEHGYDQQEPDGNVKLDMSSAEGGKSWWVQGHRMMKVWMMGGDSEKVQNQFYDDDGEEMKVMFVPANPSMRGKRTYVQFHSSGSDENNYNNYGMEDKSKAQAGVRFEEQCFNDEELIQSVTNGTTGVNECVNFCDSRISCSESGCSCQSRCEGCCTGSCAPRGGHDQQPTACCTAPLLYAGPSSNWESFSDPLVHTTLPTNPSISYGNSYLQCNNHSRVYTQEHFYPGQTFEQQSSPITSSHTLNSDTIRHISRASDSQHETMKHQLPSNAHANNTPDSGFLEHMSVRDCCDGGCTVNNPFTNGCATHVYPAGNPPEDYSKNPATSNVLSSHDRIDSSGSQRHQATESCSFPSEYFSEQKELQPSRIPTCSLSLEDKYKLYDNLLNCQAHSNVDSKAVSRGDDSEPIYSEFKETSLLNTADQNELQNSFENSNEAGMGVLSPQHLTQRLSENAQARQAVGGSDAELAQYLADERVALFLQNDEFMHELRANRDFMAALQREYEERVDASECWGEEDEKADAGGGEGGERKDSTMAKGGWGKLGHVDDATLRARIAIMGKASRKKFAQIARVFSRSGKRCSSASGGSCGTGGSGVVVAGTRLGGGGGDGGVMEAAVTKDGGGTATDHLLEAAHPLIEDDDEEEEEEEEKVLDGVVIGSIHVAELKEELSPMSLPPQLSSSPRRAR